MGLGDVSDRHYGVSNNTSEFVSGSDSKYISGSNANKRTNLEFFAASDYDSSCHNCRRSLVSSKYAGLH